MIHVQESDMLFTALILNKQLCDREVSLHVVSHILWLDTLAYW